MKTTILDRGFGYTIISHGIACGIVREKDDASVFLQGDDATEFLDEWHDLSIDHNSPNTRASRFTWSELLDTMCGGYFN